jgi:hypothetical protein
LWNAATEVERLQFLGELVEEVTVRTEHLEVNTHGVPKLKVALYEVGLRSPGGTLVSEDRTSRSASGADSSGERKELGESL